MFIYLEVQDSILHSVSSPKRCPTQSKHKPEFQMATSKFARNVHNKSFKTIFTMADYNSSSLIVSSNYGGGLCIGGGQICSFVVSSVVG